MSQLQYDRPTLTLPVGAGDHVLGPETAPVTLVEYGDYECPFCGAAHQVIGELRRILGDELRFAYRHFPLSEIHPHAFGAAEAAEAAGAQGQFWKMHDLLFTHQDRLTRRNLVDWATTLRLDVRRFASELAARRYEEVVRAQFMSGVLSGVNGTPTFFINGSRHNGGYDLPTLLAAVEAARSGG
jgi:protein-disulfide isomerase